MRKYLNCAIKKTNKIWKKSTYPLSNSKLEFSNIISAVCNGIRICSDRFLSTETTKILDELFGAGYDRQIRPQVSGPALEVELNIAIRSMGPIDESKQTFALDCYFR